jgi:PhzF family phenazine biosynthesis protein
MDMKLDRTGVVIFGEHAPGKAARLEVRAFAPAHGSPEDPVCGSGNGAVGAWLRHAGRVPDAGVPVLVTQGAAVGRAGRIRLSISEAAIRVGGQCVTCVTGTLDAIAP